MRALKKKMEKNQKIPMQQIRCKKKKNQISGTQFCYFSKKLVNSVKQI